MKTKRIISSLLAVLMLLSAFAFSASADEAQEGITVPAGQQTTNARPTIDYFTGKATEDVGGEDKEDWQPKGDRIIYTEADKLNTMTKMLEKGDYALYVDKFSGEVAVYCKSTGEALFSNPYNIADSTAVDSVKSNLMSQLVVNYTDIATGQSYDFYSYKEAVRDGDNIKGQITVRNIKSGVRVEYTIGREEARLLVPHQIKKERFETEIADTMLAAIEEIYNGEGVEQTKEQQAAYREAMHQYNRLKAFYLLQDPSKASGTVKETMEKKYPITKKMAIYTLDESTTMGEKTRLEQFIKTYCPDYSYEDLDEDHMLTEYVAEDKNPPLFKMALEYSLDDTGMTVRLPANGIRFNESLYQLNSIDILPFMGAGAYSNKETSVFSNNGGYTFFPDGSGSLFDFEKITDMGKETSIKGKVYGQDFAYHTITGTHQEVIRYPVFGIVREEDESMIEYKKELDALQAAENAAAAEEGRTPETMELEKTTEADINRSGYLAIVEEGDALMELTTYHYVVPNEYSTVKITVYPRPQDKYSIADAISVGASGAEWTVVSSRKYTGNYKVKYILLSEDENKIADGSVYDCSYVGMAKAYRDYLSSTGVLKKLTDEQVGDSIPLYIETFGAMQTTERILSIPVDVMTPLTTFDDIVTMRNELAEEGITNINFIMTGYTKGGLSEAQVPYNLKWEGAVSEDYDFDDLVAEAKDKGFGVFPDFDFAYSQSNGMFDGLTLSKHSVKTIDDRYTTRREYSATKQTYVSYFDIAISPAYYSHFYEKLTKNYLEYSPMGISVSTLGSSLNSDFDEDEPYNREDSKSFTIKAMQYFDENYAKVATSGGNAYTWKYVDYITDVALDSSRFSQAYASVPFLGMVLHGYVQIAGTPLNMEGNIDYAILKAIENGAALNFILSYQNTNNLKNDVDLSKYYSVMYDIWFEDVVAIYKEVNAVLAGVQTSTIVEHKFIEGSRIPDDDELIADAEAALKAAIEGNKKYQDDLAAFKTNNVRYARERLDEIAELLADTNVEAEDANGAGLGYIELLKDYQTTVDHIENGWPTADGTGYEGKFTEFFDTYVTDVNAKKAELKAAETAGTGIEAAQIAYNNAVGTLIGLYKKTDYFGGYKTNAEVLLNKYVEMKELVWLAENVYFETVKNSDMSAAHQADYVALLGTIKDTFEDIEENIVTSLGSAVGTDVFEAMNTKTRTILGLADETKFSADFSAEEITALLPNALDYTFVYYDADPDNNPETEEVAKPEGQGVVIENKDLTENDPVEPEKFDINNIVVREYESDTNKIVYEKYENGTAFILNFNNYTVDVVYDTNGDGINESYTIGAYGYVVLSAN